MSTAIEWTDATWNPTRGCSRVSPGCASCYAERQAYRFHGHGQPYEGLVRLGKHGPRWTGAMRLALSKLDEPTRWRKPRRVFVNSMSDLFHESLTHEQIAAVFGVMAQCPQHVFQVLTKRSGRMRGWFEWVEGKQDERPEFSPPPDHIVTTCAVNLGAQIDQIVRPWPLPNVWLGVSVENQEYADERIPDLLTTPAAVRFVSYEPAIGPVDFFAFLKTELRDQSLEGLGTRDMPGLDWIICGGESGPGARPFNAAWARQTMAQCRDAGVACFVKQMGSNAFNSGASLLDDEDPDAIDVVRLHTTRKGGTMDEWPEDLRVREFPIGNGDMKTGRSLSDMEAGR
jgi:protein gp37